VPKQRKGAGDHDPFHVQAWTPAGMRLSIARARKAPGAVNKPTSRPTAASSKFSAASRPKSATLASPRITETTASEAMRALPVTPTDMSIEIRITPVPVMPPSMKPKNAPAPSSASREK